MRVLMRSADEFQRVLDGGSAGRLDLDELAETAGRVRAVGGSLATRTGPDPVFVATLRERLVAEAAARPARTPGAARAAARSAAERRAERTAPVVLVVGRGLPRALAGAVASLLLIGGVVGLASRSSLPGDALYPVKAWLDNAAVRLADNDLDRGQTYLAQAQEHISDARDLAGRSDPSADDVITALAAAVDSVRGGQRSLDAAYTRTGDPQALLAMRDFATRALPQVEALRTQVPAAALPTLGELEALLTDSQQGTTRRIDACGPPCAGLAGATTGATTGTVPGTGATTGGPGTAPVTSPTAPGASPGTGTGASVPGVKAGTGGVGVGASGGGASVSKGGASIGGPTISASVPLPSATATLPLPTATLSSGTLGATLPSATLGPVTLPGPTLTIP